MCTSLTAQGKVNSSEGHSLICRGRQQRARLPCNLSQSVVLERGRQWSPAPSCLFPSLPRFFGLFFFYQHLSQRRSLLANPAIHHSRSRGPVPSYFSVLVPAKTSNARANIKEERETKTRRPKQSRSCAISDALFDPFITYKSTFLDQRKMYPHKNKALLTEIHLSRMFFFLKHQ